MVPVGQMLPAVLPARLVVPVADFPPESAEPYIALCVAGFLVGIYGHVIKSKIIIVIGIAMIFLAAAVFPLLLNLFAEAPEIPRPQPAP